MNIIHFTHGKVNPFGESGSSRTVYYLNKYQKMVGHNSQIWSVVDGVKERETYNRDNFVSVEMFPRISPIRSKGDGILNYIKKNMKEIGMVHFHLMWMLDKNYVANLLTKIGIPYIVTAHGAYTQDKIRNVWWKKIPAKYAYELSFLNKAAGIHAVCHEEFTSLREFGVEAPIFVVPNGIELNEIPPDLDYDYFRNNKSINGKEKFVWVGNLKPCKNIDGLIKAVAVIPEQERNKLAFIMIGPEGVDTKNYGAYLKKLAKDYNVDGSVHFVGPLYGKDKYSALVSSDIYIHPSWSEVISFAVLDAMTCSIPCIISRTSNVGYFYKHNFFTMVEPYPDEIARGIMEMLDKRNEWPQMGANARKLIESEFTWETITRQIVENYQKVKEAYKSKK